MEFSSKTNVAPRVAVIFLCGSLILTGCQSSKPGLDSNHITRVQKGEESLVLFRVTRTPTNQDPARVGLQIEAGMWQIDDEWKRSVLFAPNTARGLEGWRFLMLPPGNYLMHLGVKEVRRAEDARGPAATAKTEAFGLTVPQGQRVVYGGSFQFEHKLESHRNASDATATRKRIEPHRAPNEPAMAERVAHEMFAERGAFLPAMTTACGDLQTTLRNAKAESVVVVEHIENNITLGATTVDSGAMVMGAPFILAGGLIYESLQAVDEYNEEAGYEDDDSEGSLVLLGAAFVLMGTGAAIGFAADSAMDPVVQKNWAPHEAALRKEMAEFNFGSKLADALKSELVSGTNSRSGGVVLQLEIYRIGLRPGAAYALEIGVHVTVRAAGTKKTLWERGVVYAHERATAYLLTPYEQLTSSTSTPYPLDSYKGKAGVRQFHSELEKALDALERQIISEFRNTDP